MKSTPALLQTFFVISLLFSSVAAAPASAVTAPDPALALPAGVPCPYDSFFTCITIDVPLDHFNPADARTIPVVFAIIPASGVRKGMFVTATGGPGTSGVLLADFYSSGFDSSIFESFDIVFFDQRGMGLSGGLTCPEAAANYYLQDARSSTPVEEAALKQAASNFSADCAAEMSNPDLLPYLGTRQAVEDLEIFRQMVGDDKFWLYGESYGTQYAQTYAAVHGDHLAGLILDGTVDLTFTGFEYYTQQAQAFNDVLVDSLSVCGADPACSAAMNGDPVQAYDNLAAQLTQAPIRFRFPLPGGGFERREFTLSNLEFVAASQMYGEGDRMMFSRALAYYTANGDIVPLARLFYLSLGLDSQTLDVIPDESYSDAMFFGVECQDYGYPGTPAEEKAANYIAAGDPVEASIPRLASIFYGDLPCAYWPYATSNLTRPGYLTAPGIPTLVLGATADPATPVSHGINVYQNLADGYLITQQGGTHVIFGYGNECPDALVTDFLVNDVVPAQRETICDGYVAIAPRHAGSVQQPA